MSEPDVVSVCGKSMLQFRLKLVPHSMPGCLAFALSTLVSAAEDTSLRIPIQLTRTICQGRGSGGHVTLCEDTQSIEVQRPIRGLSLRSIHMYRLCGTRTELASQVAPQACTGCLDFPQPRHVEQTVAR